MSLMYLKQKIISSRIGVFFDRHLRILLSFVPLIHSTLFSNKKQVKPDCFIFFLYGGYGDVILNFPLIFKFAKINKVVIFCEPKVLDLEFLLPGEVKLVSYNKQSIIRERKYLKENICGDVPLLIQTSPIIEVYIFRILLGIKHSIGLVLSFSEVRSIGFKFPSFKPSKTSRIQIFDSIYKAYISSFCVSKNYNNERGINFSIERT